MNLDLTPDQRLFRQEVAAFAQAHVEPASARIDETGEFPWALVKLAGTHGLAGMTIPERGAEAAVTMPRAGHRNRGPVERHARHHPHREQLLWARCWRGSAAMRGRCSGRRRAATGACAVGENAAPTRRTWNCGHEVDGGSATA
jgi:alkylation response protein AidB-like acyl-CoA dehydrogenase